jgi:16S rRNA (guanine(1405)-N(7))-methyltransferase
VKNDESGELDELVRMVLGSSKYRHVCEELVRHVGAREIAVRRRLKEAVKATRSKLHQVGGAYFEARIDYQRWLAELAQARESGDEECFRATCREMMGLHASTRERIDILEVLYGTVLERVRPVRSVLDVACGLNPLAIPWLGLEAGATYHACDAYTDLVGFVRAFLPLAGVRGTAEACDVTRSPPTGRADLALVLKTIPCLEQLEKGAGRRLLEVLDADHVLVSFPAHSLGGAGKGMVENYALGFGEMVRGRPWGVERFEFSTELAFLVSKGP